MAHGDRRDPAGLRAPDFSTYPAVAALPGRRGAVVVTKLSPPV